MVRKFSGKADHNLASNQYSTLNNENQQAADF
jgi:hypothetical protein